MPAVIVPATGKLHLYDLLGEVSVTHLNADIDVYTISVRNIHDEDIGYAIINYEKPSATPIFHKLECKEPKALADFIEIVLEFSVTKFFFLYFARTLLASLRLDQTQQRIFRQIQLHFTKTKMASDAAYPTPSIRFFERRPVENGIKVLSNIESLLLHPSIYTNVDFMDMDKVIISPRATQLSPSQNGLPRVLTFDNQNFLMVERQRFPISFFLKRLTALIFQQGNELPHAEFIPPFQFFRFGNCEMKGVKGGCILNLALSEHEVLTQDAEQKVHLKSIKAGDLYLIDRTQLVGFRADDPFQGMVLSSHLQDTFENTVKQFIKRCR